MKKTRGLYHVFERRYLNFSSRTFLKILVIHTAPTVDVLENVFFIAKNRSPPPPPIGEKNSKKNYKFF
jgi:hypothetical protein